MKNNIFFSGFIVSICMVICIIFSSGCTNENNFEMSSNEFFISDDLNNNLHDYVEKIFSVSSENKKLQLGKVLESLNVDRGIVININQCLTETDIYGIEIGFKENAGYIVYYYYKGNEEGISKIVIFENGEKKQIVQEGLLSENIFDEIEFDSSFFNSILYIETITEVIDEEKYSVEIYSWKDNQVKFYFLNGELKMIYDSTNEKNQYFLVKIGKSTDFDESWLN